MGAIAQDFADRMGFSEASGKAARRWVAVCHCVSTNGNDHLHSAVSLVREDGTKQRLITTSRGRSGCVLTLNVSTVWSSWRAAKPDWGARVKSAERARQERTGAAPLAQTLDRQKFYSINWRVVPTDNRSIRQPRTGCNG